MYKRQIQIGITLGWFQKISVAVGSCRRKRIRLHLRIMIAIPVEDVYKRQAQEVVDILNRFYREDKKHKVGVN